jgi:hypothetical protein
MVAIDTADVQDRHYVWGDPRAFIPGSLSGRGRAAGRHPPYACDLLRAAFNVQQQYRPGFQRPSANPAEQATRP